VNVPFVTAATITSLCAALAACAPSPSKSDELPLPLRVTESQVLKQKLHANGVQIYLCRPLPSDAARFEWSFKQPEATLFNKQGSNIGKHYAGPTWEANDGSKVTGEVVARSNATGADAIPWLLLNAKTTSGTGIFAAVKSIQRLNTVGGAAPAAGCGAAQAGQELRVSYTADYLFYE
jgi:hypothetical protein